MSDFEQWEKELGGPYDDLGQCLCRGTDLCGSAYCDRHGEGYEARKRRGDLT